MINHIFMSFSGEAWKEIFNSLKNTCKETKLVERKKGVFLDTELKQMTNASIVVNKIQLITHLMIANLLNTV